MTAELPVTDAYEWPDCCAPELAQARADLEVARATEQVLLDVIRRLLGDKDES